MDKYIKMLLIKISQKYKVTITTIMSYDGEQNRVKNIYKIFIKSKETESVLYDKAVYNKRNLLSELVKWQN